MNFKESYVKKSLYKSIITTKANATIQKKAASMNKNFELTIIFKG